MSTTGQVLPGSAVTASESPWSDDDWVNPTNIYGAGEASVTAATFDAGDQTYVLKAYNFNLAGVPDGATIFGVIVTVNARYATALGKIDLVQLLDVSRAKVGTNKASTPVDLTTSAADYTFGSASDLWGNALTPTWVKDADFGVAVGMLAGGSGNNNVDVYCDYVKIEIYYGFVQSVSGAITPSGVIVKQGQAVKVGAITAGGVLSKQAQTAKVGGMTAAGGLVRSIGKNLAGALSLAGVFKSMLWEIWRKDGIGGAYNLIRSIAYGIFTYDDNYNLVGGTTYYHKVRRVVDGEAETWSNETTTGFVSVILQSIAGGLTLAGELVRETRKGLAGAVTIAGEAAKRTATALTGAVSSAGELARQAGKVLAGAGAGAGELAREARKVLSGSLGSAGAVVKQTYKSLTGAVTSSGVVTGIRTVLVAIVGTVSLAGGLAKQAGKNLAGTATGAGELVRRTYKIVTGTVIPSGALATSKVFSAVLAGVVTMAGSLVKQVGKGVDGAVTLSGSVIKAISKFLSGVWGWIGSLASELLRFSVPGRATASFSVIHTATNSFSLAHTAVDAFSLMMTATNSLAARMVAEITHAGIMTASVEVSDNG